MPSNITEVSTWTTPVTVPASGDARTAASVNGAFQALANRTLYLSQALHAGAAHLPSVASDGTNVAVGAGAYVIGGRAYTAAAATVALSGLSANQWYYVYASVSGSAIAYVVSASGPEGSLTWLDNSGTSDTTRRYVASVYATGATAVRPFRAAGRRYVWRRRDYNSLRVIETATPVAGYQDLAVAAWLPPHARLFEFVAGFLDAGSTTNPVFHYRTKGDTDPGSELYPVRNQRVAVGAVAVETDATRTFQYALAEGSSGVTGLEIFAHGFME